MKDLCHKMEQCLEIIDVGCDLKQFDGLTHLPPIFTTDLRHRTGRKMSQKCPIAVFFSCARKHLKIMTVWRYRNSIVIVISIIIVINMKRRAVSPRML